MPGEWYYQMLLSLSATDVPINNQRFTSLSFQCNSTNTVIHGFAGYFDTILYKDIKLSKHDITL